MKLYTEKKPKRREAHPLSKIHSQVAKSYAENLLKLHRGEIGALEFNKRNAQSVKKVLEEHFPKKLPPDTEPEEVIATVTSLLSLVLSPMAEASQVIDRKLTDVIELQGLEDKETEKAKLLMELAREIVDEFYDENNRPRNPEYVREAVRAVFKNFRVRAENVVGEDHISVLEEAINRILDFYEAHGSNNFDDGKAALYHNLYLVYHTLEAISRSMSNVASFSPLGKVSFLRDVMVTRNRLSLLRRAIQHAIQSEKDPKRRSHLQAIEKELERRENLLRQQR